MDKTVVFIRVLVGRAGVHVYNVRLAKAALQQACCGTFQLSELYVAYIEVQLPSWRRRLRIHLRGVVVNLRQRQMPQVLVYQFPLIVRQSKT